MIPPLDHRGLLPMGTHTAEWNEIEERFATNGHRQQLYGIMRRFVADELVSVATGLDLFFGGSYFTDKEHPGDMDCTVFIPFDHIPHRMDLINLSVRDGGKGRIWNQYHVELYPSLGVPGHNDFRLFFQYVGEKTAIAKNLHERDLRGIIKVESWVHG